MKQLRTYLAGAHKGLKRPLTACLGALALGLALLAAMPQAAQAEGELVGQIKGTNMTRDEFRGRAMAQLATIALNAVTYYQAHGEYPAEFYRLRGSDSWNLDVANMFNGRPVQSIMFDASPADMTSDPAIGLPGFELPHGGAMAPAGGLGNPGGTSNSGGDGVQPPGTIPDDILVTSVSSSRVDPRRVRNYQGGDILYYVHDQLLQLVLFAPDGTYFEWVDEVPNHSFSEHLHLRGSDPSGQLLSSAEVLYFSQYLLPKYYNLVQFMSSLPVDSPQVLEQTSASRRIEMAQSFGVTIRNPLNHQPIAVAKQGGAADAGNFADESSDLGLLLADGSPATLANLALEPGETPQSVAAQTPKQGGTGRQPGGSKGGGRQPGGGKGGGRQPH